MSRAPKPSSIVVVMATALPLRVDDRNVNSCRFRCRPRGRERAATSGTADRRGCALPMDLSGLTSAGAALEVAGVGETLYRHVHEARVAKIERAVGEGEAAGLPRTSARLPARGAARLMSRASARRGSEAAAGARARRAHAADRINPVFAAHGRTLRNRIAAADPQGWGRRGWSGDL